MKKIQDKVDKAERDTELATEKYNGALADLNSYNGKYMEEMTEVIYRFTNTANSFIRHFHYPSLSLSAIKTM